MKNVFGLLSVVTLLYSFAAWAGENNAAFKAVDDPFDYTGFALMANTTPPVQRIDVVNMLWNPNATGGAAGVTQTAVTVNFFAANGNTKPCSTATLAFEGATTVLAGTGQPCTTAVGSVAFVTASGPAGSVFDGNNATVTLDANAYSTQLIITDGQDPVFDSTNGSVKTAGKVGVTKQAQF